MEYARPPHTTEWAENPRFGPLLFSHYNWSDFTTEALCATNKSSTSICTSVQTDCGDSECLQPSATIGFGTTGKHWCLLTAKCLNSGISLSIDGKAWPCINKILKTGSQIQQESYFTFIQERNLLDENLNRWLLVLFRKVSESVPKEEWMNLCVCVFCEELKIFSILKTKSVCFFKW